MTPKLEKTIPKHEEGISDDVMLEKMRIELTQNCNKLRESLHISELYLAAVELKIKQEKK